MTENESQKLSKKIGNLIKKEWRIIIGSILMAVIFFIVWYLNQKFQPFEIFELESEVLELITIIIGAIGVVVTAIMFLLVLIYIRKRRKTLTREVEKKRKYYKTYYKEFDIIDQPIQEEFNKLETIQTDKNPEEAKAVLERIETITLRNWFLEEQKEEQIRLLSGLEKQLEILSRTHTEYNKSISQTITMILTFSALMFVVIGLLWNKDVFIQMSIAVKSVLAFFLALAIIPLIIIMMKTFGDIFPSKETVPTKFALESLQLDIKQRKTTNEIIFDLYSSEIRKLNDEHNKRRGRLVNIKRMIMFYTFELLMVMVVTVFLFSGIV